MILYDMWTTPECFKKTLFLMWNCYLKIIQMWCLMLTFYCFVAVAVVLWCCCVMVLCCCCCCCWWWLCVVLLLLFLNFVWCGDFHSQNNLYIPLPFKRFDVCTCVVFYLMIHCVQGFNKSSVYYCVSRW